MIVARNHVEDTDLAKAGPIPFFREGTVGFLNAGKSPEMGLCESTKGRIGHVRQCSRGDKFTSLNMVWHAELVLVLTVGRLFGDPKDMASTRQIGFL